MSFAAKQIVVGIDTDQTSRRKAPRDGCSSACVVRFLPSGSWIISALDGWTRNLSRGGISLILRRMFSRDEPVEVELKLPDRQSIYFAGVVAACRYAGRGMYEVGVSLRVVNDAPIFSHDPDAAVDLRLCAPPEDDGDGRRNCRWRHVERHSARDVLLGAADR